jgi:hypothetical protein
VLSRHLQPLGTTISQLHIQEGIKETKEDETDYKLMGKYDEDDEL